MLDEVEIEEFDERFAADFALLNYEWIEKYYVVEPHDRELLDHPFENILVPGGQIFFAVVNGRAVGTVAMLKYGESSFELAKMAVSPAARNAGIGRRLIESCVRFASANGAAELVLESNTELSAAIHLYRSFGFRETPLDPNSPYRRANIRMRLAIQS